MENDIYFFNASMFHMHNAFLLSLSSRYTDMLMVRKLIDVNTIYKINFLSF